MGIPLHGLDLFITLLFVHAMCKTIAGAYSVKHIPAGADARESVMKSYLERVIAEVPQFFSHFSQCLFRPSRFIAAELARQEQPDAISKGVDFLILSFLLMLFISQVLPEATSPLQLPGDDAAFVTFASAALFDLFRLFFAAVICFAAFRLAGVSGSFWQFFSLFAFFAGVSMVLLVFANALTNIGFIDPIVAKSHIALEQLSTELQHLTEQMLCSADSQTGELSSNALAASDPQWQQLNAAQQRYNEALTRPLAQLGMALQLLVALLLFIWLCRVWFAYGRMLQLSSSRITTALLISLLLLFVGGFVIELMQTGSDMMALYRRCASPG